MFLSKERVVVVAAEIGGAVVDEVDAAGGVVIAGDDFGAGGVVPVAAGAEGASHAVHSMPENWSEPADLVIPLDDVEKLLTLLPDPVTEQPNT